ncbi:GATA zinc finger domain-containing protein 14 isoform X2 [Chironomus tepperi]|uniref:GATA zinc finger domain-containing protein 14 isoform X2 n=1 Tax=Chironomus tepperi TaxID=113505 RepID=UPI00391FC632
MSTNNSNNENNEKSINDNLSSSVPKVTNTNATSRKKVTKKPSRNGQQPNLNSSYEHHLEKWLENASKMNFDYNNFDGNWPLMNSSSGATNRKGNHLQYSSADPISLPPHINLDSSPSISAFMNFNTQFRQQYPHLIQRQQSASPISNDPLTSLSTQPDFYSLPTFGSTKIDKIPSTDQEKLNDVINQSKRFNDLLIDDTPHSNMNSTRPNESSAEDELDEEGQTDEDNDKQQKLENGASSNDLNNRNIFRTLLKQIHLLHETNSKLFRSLHETKGGNYTPGIVTDLIREVRDAGRVRDESLMNRVKALIEEKSWSHNETNMRVLRELEEVKVHLHNVKLERQTTNERLLKLEDEVRTIKAFLGVNNNPFQQYSHFTTPPNNSNLAIHDQTKRNSNLSLNYGVINSTGDNFQFDDQPSNFHQHRHPSQSPPKRHETSLNENDEDSFDKSHVIQLEKDTLKLRRDLQDALAGKKHAESRIIALEHVVTSLKSPSQQTNTNHHPTTKNNTNNSANKNSLQSEFHQPQQHQLQIQINGGDVKRKISTIEHSQPKNGSVTTTQTVTKLLSPPKGVKASQVTLSTSGPITDL